LLALPFSWLAFHACSAAVLTMLDACFTGIPQKKQQKTTRKTF
jgi:hypothetical protein